MKKVSSGKVRDVYKYDSVYYGNELCFVASDAVSAFDSVIPGLKIEGKGKILTAISRHWAELIDRPDGFGGNECATAYTDLDDEQLDQVVKAGLDLDRVQQQLHLEMIPIEAIVRGYITGSMWQAYQDGRRKFDGLELPDGLKEGDRLPEPLFTPTTKAPVGQHDEELTFEEMVEHIERADLKNLSNYGYSVRWLAGSIREYAISLYLDALVYARSVGIIIADTKFEFGLHWTGRLLIGDEILTPDSSRFWLEKDYEPGHAQKSLDKQLIRDYIKEQRAKGVTRIELPPALISEVQDAYGWILATLFPHQC